MKILIATDGSNFSEAAVEQVCRMVTKLKDASIKVVSTYEPPLMAAAAPYATPAVYSPALEREMKEVAAQAVSWAESKLREQLPDLNGDLTTEVLRGSPGREIVQQVDEWGADLVVVGSHGYGFWERAVLGSVSHHVVHHAPCSVLVARISEKPEWQQELSNGHD